MKKETCKTCKFWKSAGDFGECKAHAPSYAPEHYPFSARWPTTKHHDWCGDYKQNPEVV